MRALVEALPFVPLTCTWELTLRCNLNCGHCGSHAGAARPGEMDRDTAVRVASELAQMGCKRLTLSGGEPTLSPYWADVARAATQGGTKVNMITNGLLADRDLIRQAKSAGIVNLGISLDGLEPQHDSIRGRPGMFKRVMKVLDDCAAEAMPIGVITTVGKNNMRQLPAVRDLIDSVAFVWQVQLAAAMGNQRAQSHPQIDPVDLLELVPDLACLVKTSRVSVRPADSIGYFGPYESVLRSTQRGSLPCWTGCFGGCRHLGIQADGSVKGCLSMQATDASEGNLKVSSLREIWERPGAFAHNRDFHVEQLTGFCRDCEHAEICRGGCHSMRLCEGGGENPFCYHRVATLADRKRPRKARSYVPLAIAPAALLALAGCSSTSASAFYGCPVAEDGGGCGQIAADAYGMDVSVSPVKDSGHDAKKDVHVTGTDAYGIAADAYGIAVMDAYGVSTVDAGHPHDARPDQAADARHDARHDADSAIIAADAYGVTTPEAGHAVDAPITGGDAYGIPVPDAAHWEGAPSASDPSDAVS